MFREYFGALTPDTTEQELLNSEIKKIKSENAALSAEVAKVKQ